MLCRTWLFSVLVLPIVSMARVVFTGAMTRFVIFFTLTGETIARFIERPSDRAAAVRALLEPVGGKLVSYDFMFGEDDGMVVFEVPDSHSAAAISLAVSSTGVFGRLRTH